MSFTSDVGNRSSKYGVRDFALWILAAFMLFLPFSIAPKNIFMVLTILVGLYCIVRQGGAFFKLDMINVSLLLLAVALFFSSYISGASIADSFVVNRDIFRMVLVFFAVRGLDMTPSELRKYFIGPLLISFIIVFGIGVYETYLLDAHKGGRFRMMGPVNRSAIYMLLMFSFSLATFVMTSSGKVLKSLVSVAWCLAFVGIVIAASRSAWIALFVLVILFMLLLHGEKRLKVTLLLVMCLSVAIAYSIDSVVIFKKLKFGVPYRFGIWEAGFDYYISHANKLLGIGTGNYKIINLAPYTGGRMLSNVQSHNMFISFLVENGALGLLSFILFLFSSIVFTVKKRLSSETFFLTSVLCLVSMVISCGFHNALMREFGMLFFILMAVSISQLGKVKLRDNS